MATRLELTHTSGHDQSWQTAKLKYVARFAYGDSLSSTDSEQGTVPVFGSNGPYATTAEPNTLSPVIVVGRKGSYGKVNWSSRDVFASDTTFFIDRSTTEHDLRWFYWVLQTLGLDTTSDDAAVPGLNRENAYNQPVLLPPLPTQRAIADYLDAETARIDALIAAKEKLLSILAEKRKALVTEAVTRGLDPSVPMRDSGIPWLGEIPAHWKEVRLRFLFDQIEQGWSPQAESREPAEDEWGVLKLGAVNRGRFDGHASKALPAEIEPRSDYEVMSGDFLLTRANTPALVGDVCFVEVAPPKLMLCDLIYRLRLREKLICGRFLAHFLGLPLGRCQIESDARGTSGSMVKISQEHIKNWLIPLPPLAEQRAIVARVTSQTMRLDAIAGATRTTIELLKERREAIIAAAVAGQLDLGAS